MDDIDRWGFAAAIVAAAVMLLLVAGLVVAIAHRFWGFEGVFWLVGGVCAFILVTYEVHKRL